MKTIRLETVFRLYKISGISALKSSRKSPENVKSIQDSVEKFRENVISLVLRGILGDFSSHLSTTAPEKCSPEWLVFHIFHRSYPMIYVFTDRYNRSLQAAGRSFSNH